MKRFRHPFDPLKWHFILNIFGMPTKFELERGFVYNLYGTLGPDSRLRILDEDGDGRFAAQSYGEGDYYFSTKFTMEKDAGSYVMIQYVGEVPDVHFSLAGIDMEEFA